MNTLKEISRAIWGIYQHYLPRPVQGIIFVGQGPKRYRPIINRAKALGKELINCEVLLIEDVGGPLQNVDKPLGALLTSIRIAVRIKMGDNSSLCVNRAAPGATKRSRETEFQSSNLLQ